MWSVEVSSQGKGVSVASDAAPGIYLCHCFELAHPLDWAVNSIFLITLCLFFHEVFEILCVDH